MDWLTIIELAIATAGIAYLIYRNKKRKTIKQVKQLIRDKQRCTDFLCSLIQ